MAAIRLLGARAQRAISLSQRWSYLTRNVYRSASGVPDQMPPCDFQPSPYTGKSYEETLATRKEHVSPGYLTYYKNPILIHQGHMQWVFDHTGRRYLDLFGGIVTVSVGHCHPKVSARVKDQMDKLWHLTNIYMHPGIHDYAEKLASKLPGDLKVVYFTNSGGEANELAMLMARLHTGAFDIVSLRNCYHGTSPYTQGLTGMGTWKYPFANGFGVHHAMNPDVYRGLWGGSNCRDSLSQTTRSCDCSQGNCNACDMYVEQFRDTIKFSVPKGKLAAFFVEPIQGVGGGTQYPKDFLRRAFEVTRESGGVCVADEVQTGFGRLGSHFWGFEAAGVTPDIVTMAKGIGNGFPLAAVVTTPEIASTMTRSLHFNTYGGNPLACAAGSAVLDVIEEEGIQEKAGRVGRVFIEHLMSLRDEFECVGDVRGKGLMLAVELVTDKATQEPLPAADMNQIWEECKENGVLIGKGGFYGNIFRIKPPMCVTEDDVIFSTGVLRNALRNYTQSK
ncbi:alanine--glyoxylate aminotransferase 2, mitochondrial-like [Halichondria panicea]|uniref:alanine--glyoxylate aminotransferase 2, mitochondrial-like n=1 Tax=Halichondria panicea TaxID=6063 RepID=UPI00312BBEBB